MVIFSNLRVWNAQQRDFLTQDLEVSSIEDSIRFKEKEINSSELIGIPPGIDIHVHFREPGFEHKETMTTGALAALSGGITTVLDMPNTDPITDSVKKIEEKKSIASRQKFVDILISSAITNKNTDSLAEIDKHCDAYKIFMSESFGKLMVDYKSIEKSLATLEKIESNKPVIFHAEDPNILEQNKDQKTHEKRRPPEAEASAIQQIFNWASEYKKLKFHITHLSSSLSLRIVEMLLLENVTTDTCPRYLWFDQESSLPEDLKRVNPPIRNSVDRNQLIKSLAVGSIDMISSDHSPHTLEEKRVKKLSGMPGVQELLPSLITLVKQCEIEWERAIEALHVFPQKLLNIEDEKTNLIILDINKPFEITKKIIKTKSKWSPFEGKLLFGNVLAVIKDEKIISSAF